MISIYFYAIALYEYNTNNSLFFEFYFSYELKTQIRI